MALGLFLIIGVYSAGILTGLFGVGGGTYHCPRLDARIYYG